MHNPVAASVIVPSRGGARRLPVLLAALSRQSTDDFEVIVVVDGDTDDSAGYLKSVSADVPFRLQAIVFGENKGRTAALNAGFEKASGRVLVRCDDDLEPRTDFLERHIAGHQGEPAGVIGLYENILPHTPYARVYGRNADRKFRRDAMAAEPENQWRYWAGNVSVLRDVHFRIKGYDPRYRTYGWEDVDYGYRLHKAGVKVRIDPQLSTPHHVAATTTPIRALRALHSGAARELFIELHGSDALGKGPQRTGIWGNVVWAASAVATEKSVGPWAAFIDRTAGLLPGAVAEKLVALTVESAGLAGIRYPTRALSRF
ncbi:glycosyltransferase involved in cell wall biosynthesis [Pseudarthrobacter sp. W1I19]|uniref:glycosyltransferase family 2 protein n=1 Tax=Pseudarthrobacter sp. W1I19 TaxID=3042288 RepID=UPI00278B0B18|nr:glycosyltransferase family A protein [Pseudarthrobacter sp. W1I19]MDQ0922279.1 glycosyltransferase involved in cell wall biosynthesis [Pseudarthrobacter sp. W1I19]